jgi:hypothetical protein
MAMEEQGAGGADFSSFEREGRLRIRFTSHSLSITGLDGRTSNSDDATTAWFNKRPGEMSMKELKLAISNAGLRTDTDGFVEKSEFIALLESYLTDINGQDECPVCLEVLNLSVKTIRLPCHHLMCKNCLCSIVSRENLSCTCPLCRESVSETALGGTAQGATSRGIPNDIGRHGS